MKEAADESISLSLRLIKVNELARHGRLKEAQALLAPDGNPPENPVALHTLAALVTKEGNYPRALALWKSLLQREPKHPDAPEMIAAIETWTTRPAWVRFFPAGAGALAVVLVVVVGWWALRPAPHPPAATPFAASSVVAPASASARPAPASSPAYAAPPANTDAPPVKFQLSPPPAKTKKN